MTALPWQSQPDDPADYISTLARHVCQLICTEDVKAYEIALAIREARLECARLLPEKIELFDLVYGARFERLKEQFRE
jgi:hypothetical protein